MNNKASNPARQIKHNHTFLTTHIKRNNTCLTAHNFTHRNIISPHCTNLASGLPDLIEERRKRFEHFELMQKRKLDRELEHEVTARDKLISLRTRQTQVSPRSPSPKP